MTQPDMPNPYEPPNSKIGSVHDEVRRDREDPKPSTTERLIVLATFDNSVRAHALRNELEDNGIDASVGNEMTTAIFGSTIGGPSSAFWIEVLVLESDANQALVIKNRWLAEVAHG